MTKVSQNVALKFDSATKDRTFGTLDPTMSKDDLAGKFECTPLPGTTSPWDKGAGTRKEKRTLRFRIMNLNTCVGLLEAEETGLRGWKLGLPKYITNEELVVHHRLRPSDRPSVDRILTRIGAYNLFRFLTMTHAVSLTDTLWVKEDGSSITWEDISPYRNPIPEYIGGKVLDILSGEIEAEIVRNTVSPDLTSLGTANKRWKRINGKNYLYKACGPMQYEHEGSRALNEVYASQVIKALGWGDNAVEYKLKLAVDYDGTVVPIAVCPAFTSENTGLIEYAYVEDGIHDDFGKILNKMGQRPDLFEHMRKMLILDCIIMNTDRHFENFGFLIDNRTMTVKRMAPIYDNDISLGLGSRPTGNFEQDIQRSVNKGSRIPPGGTWEEQASAVLTPDLLEAVAELRGFKFEPIGGECDLSPIRLEMMNYIVNRQVETLLKLGAN